MPLPNFIMNMWLIQSLFANLLMFGALCLLTYLYRQVDDELHTRKKLDGTLDTIFRTFYLHSEDPYVTLPGYDDDKRCYHCRHPYSFGHDHTCIWKKAEPIRKLFYKTS